MKHVHYVASPPQQLLRLYCTRTLCINFLWMTSSFARFLAGGQPISAWRIAEAVAHSSRLRCFTITKRFGWAARTARLKRACHDSTALLVRNCESFHNSTGNEPVNQMLEKYAWNCSIAVLSVCCWCSDVAKVWTSSDAKSQGHVGLSMQTKILVLFLCTLPTDPVPEPYATVIYSNEKNSQCAYRGRLKTRDLTSRDHRNCGGWHRQTWQDGSISHGWTSRDLFHCASRSSIQVNIATGSIIWAAHRVYVCSFT